MPLLRLLPAALLILPAGASAEVVALADPRAGVAVIRPGGPPPPAAAASVELDLAAAPSLAPCRPEDDDEVVVCRRSDARYRLPAQKGFDPYGQRDSVLRERSRLLEGGESGIHSCNFVVGAASWTGCELKGMERARQQGRSVSRFGDIRIGGR